MAIVASERERKLYALQHYVNHLIAAENWDQLWDTLNHNGYRHVKLHYDPSTRAYARDLDSGRQAAGRDRCEFSEGLILLPRLWQYSLLYCILNSQTNEFPDEAFDILVLLGRENEAITRVELITYPVRQAELYCRIGEISSEMNIQIERLAFARAEQIAFALSDKHERSQVLNFLVSALARTKQFERAERLSYEIPNEALRTTSLMNLALAQSEVGQFTFAEQLAKSIAGDDKRAQILEKLAGFLAQAREFAEAERIIQDIPDNQFRHRDSALVILLRAFAQAGRYPRAEEIAASVRGGWLRVEGYTALAVAQAQAGYEDAARRSFAAAEHAARSDEYSCGRALARLGEALVLAGFTGEAANCFANAEEFARTRLEPNAYSSTLKELLPIMIRSGHIKNARKMIQNIPANWIWERVEVRACVAQALAEVGEYDTAERIFRRIRPEPFGCRIETLVTLANAVTHDGQFERAEKFAQLIPDIESRVSTLVSITGIIARAGKIGVATRCFTIAEEILQTLPYGWYDADALTLLVEALTQNPTKNLKAHFVGVAEEIIQDIPVAVRRAEALIMLAKGLTQNGQIDSATRYFTEAETIINSIPDDIYCQRAQSLIKLAGELTRTGRFDMATRCFAAIEGIFNQDIHLLTRRELQSALVDVLVQTGQFAQTEQFISTISEESSNTKPDALVKLVKGLAQTGQFVDAERILQHIPLNSRQRTQALVTLAGELIWAGQSVIAERIIRDIPDDRNGYRSEVLTTVAAEFVRVGQVDRAVTYFTLAEESIKALGKGSYPNHIQALLKLAQAWTGAGYPDEALRCFRAADQEVQDISSYQTRFEGIIKLAQAWAGAGYPDEALRCFRAADQEVQDITHDENQDAARGMLALGLIRAAQFTAAEDVITTIKEFERAALAMVALGEALAEAACFIDLLALVRRIWRRATTYQDLILIFPVVIPLVRHYPDLGNELFGGFKWVDHIWGQPQTKVRQN